MKHARSDYDHIQDPSGKIPDDEPVFLLRAQDETGAATVRHWASLQPAGELRDRANQQACDMEMWNVKKTADGPHCLASAPLVVKKYPSQGPSELFVAHVILQPRQPAPYGYPDAGKWRCGDPDCRHPNCKHAPFEAAVSATAPIWDMGVRGYVEKHAHRWTDMTEKYWLSRLLEEVGEVTSTVDGLHDGPLAHELRQVASICINWLRHRSEVPEITDAMKAPGAKCGHHGNLLHGKPCPDCFPPADTRPTLPDLPEGPLDLVVVQGRADSLTPEQMRQASAEPNRTTTDGKPSDPACEGTGAPKPINPETGQHGAYYVLTEEERAKGFVRPVRRAYRHVGLKPKHPLRDLTDDEKERNASEGFVKFEEYPESESPVTGRFWTQQTLDGGCGTETIMAVPIAETYARDPSFYGSTFCTSCRKHIPVDQFVWLDDGTRVGS